LLLGEDIPLKLYDPGPGDSIYFILFPILTSDVLNAESTAF